MNVLPLLNPIALSLGPLNVTWYGIILGTAALVGLLLAIQEGKRFKISPDFFMDLLLIGVPSAIIAARLYYVAFEWQTYKGHWYEIIAIWHGGIAIHGALIGAVIGAVIYTRVKKVSFWRIADIAAPSLIVGQMIGRWGNFVNQEAHGGPVDPSFLSDTLHLPGWIVDNMLINGEYYHPTFLYESFWNLCVLLVLLWLRRRTWLRAGELFLSYFALYSVGRFFIEGLRTDSLAFDGPNWLASMMNGLWSPMELLFGAQGALPAGGGDVRTAQFISLMLILLAVGLMVWRRKAGYASERYLDPVVFGSKAPAEEIVNREGSNDGSNGDGNSGGNDNSNDKGNKTQDINGDKDNMTINNSKADTSNGETSQENEKPVYERRYDPPGNPFL